MSAPRGWFQIHLMTAIVLMFAAGGLIKLNMSVGREFSWISCYKQEGNVYDPLIEKTRACGWPWSLRELDNQIAYYPATDITKPGSTIQLPVNQTILNWPMLLADTGVGVLILICVAAVCESLLRRSERSKINTVQSASH